MNDFTTFFKEVFEQLLFIKKIVLSVCLTVPSAKVLQS